MNPQTQGQRDAVGPTSAKDDILLEVRDVHHAFGAHPVLYDLNLQIGRGHVIGLVGPSGCGKTTLLRAIVGTHPPARGAILVNGKPVEGPARDRGIVYQHYSLYPFLTALDNVAFGPLLDQTDGFFRWLRPFQYRELRRKHRDEAAALLERIGLGAALNRYPHQLSGGMRQRVAIAQALIMKPEILVLDEPFGALDEATREDLQDMLVGLYHENLKAEESGDPPPYTILIVTHELTEALYVANRVVGLSQYWDYKGAGHSACPGATVVYDRAAPLVCLDQARDPSRFVAQRHEIRSVVFEPEEGYAPAEHRTFWREDAARRGRGDEEESRDAPTDHDGASPAVKPAPADESADRTSEDDSPDDAPADEQA